MKNQRLLPIWLICAGLFLVLWLGFTAESTVPVAQAADGTAQQPTQRTELLAQVVLTPTKDNTLYESTTGALSNGAGAGMFVGKTNRGSIRRGLVAFDLAGRIPTTATIISVTLRLNMAKTTAGANSVTLHKVTADWGEGASNAGGSGGGDGTAAATNDATWLHTFFNTQQWQTAGGDFVATASASTSVAGTGAYTWGSTSGMIADVQGWISNPASNFGWIVVGNEAASGTAKLFDSKESAAANRPQLTIVYQSAGDNNLKVYLAVIQK